MRQKYRVTYVDSQIHTTQLPNNGGEVRYQMGRGTDGSSFQGESIIFTFSCAAEDQVKENDVISGELSDPRYPTVLQDIFVEERYVDPSTIIQEPEPLQIPQESAPEPAPLEDEWRYAVANGSYLAEIDIAQMARALVRLEARVKQLESCKS